MGKIVRAILLLAGVIIILIVAYVVVRATASLRQGYSWSEMDWKERGSTSLSDFFAASDIGKRIVMKDGCQCIEYYAYKDGLAVKTVCPK